MATTTSRLGLTKPDSTDLVDIDVLNANANKLDAAAGSTVCTSTTRPPAPYSGQKIFETDTKKEYVYAGGWYLINDVQRANIIINGRFAVNQRAYASGSALASGSYGFDRWKSAAAGSSMTFTAAPNGQQVTLSANAVFQQIIERQNIVPGQYTLSWAGTATARVYNSGASAPAYANSPVTVTLDGTQNVVVEVTAAGATKTLDYVKIEQGEIATAWEPFGGSYISEATACNRYYVSDDVNFVAVKDVTFNLLAFQIRLPAKMRTVPTVTPTACDLTGHHTILPSVDRLTKDTIVFSWNDASGGVRDGGRGTIAFTASAEL